MTPHPAQAGCWMTPWRRLSVLLTSTASVVCVTSVVEHVPPDPPLGAA